VERGGEKLAINPIDQAFPSGKVIIRREERVGGRAMHPPRQQWPSEEGRGESVDPIVLRFQSPEV